ncbi:unnamed protein product [Mucor circinelloides]
MVSFMDVCAGTLIVMRVLVDENIAESGPVEPDTPYDQIRKEPIPLPKEFEFCEIDMEDDKQVKELYELLTMNYVEDDDAQFRFDYSAEFLKWALLPPNQKKSWLVGVRVASNKKLVAFISGVPVAMRTYDVVHKLTEINFLCVHKKLRSKRLAPVLIKEITRRSHLEGVFQATYTAGAVLPKPVSTCRYYHRSLNPKKLVECNFSRIPPKSTLSRMVKSYKVPEKTSTAGLREMRPEDAPQVRVLLNKYLQRFDFAPVLKQTKMSNIGSCLMIRLFGVMLLRMQKRRSPTSSPSIHSPAQSSAIPSTLH